MDVLDRVREIGADTRDDDVGRGTDLGDQPAEKRRKGHRHQKHRGGDVRATRHLEGDRDHDGEGADILDEGRERRDHGDEDEQLDARR